MQILEDYIAAEKAGVRENALLGLKALVKEVGSDAPFEVVQPIIARLEHDNIAIRFPLFAEVIFPSASRALESGNDIRALKVLIKYNQHILQLKNSSPLASMTEWGLCDYGLTRWPDDKELLERKAKVVSGYLAYTLHELPSGVLYDTNGADSAKCSELVETLEDYEGLIHKLGREDKELIERCRWHYTHYPIYLNSRQRWGSYAAYIEKNGPNQA